MCHQLEMILEEKALIFGLSQCLYKNVLLFTHETKISPAQRQLHKIRAKEYYLDSSLFLLL